jgi:LuxR family transcriptional regulator, maltose regulon positive regulatory protein
MPFAKVVQTKITPPHTGRKTLHRPRVLEALLEALNHRLTLLQAGAGYGKSTALASLASRHQPLVWYSVTEEDGDPLVFLLHLCHATRQALPDLEDLPIALLDAWEGARGLLPAAGVIDAYINSLSKGTQEPVLLVLDDIHLADSQSSTAEIGLLIDRLISLAPPNLHILLAARGPVRLPNLARWRAQGEALSIDQTILAFSPEEIKALYAQQYRYELTTEEAEQLSSATEGWAIALHLIWQSLRSRASASVEDALAYPANSLDSLFEILAKEVFGNQPVDVQEFMLVSATLREMNAEACDALREHPDSASMLAYLRRQDLFVVEAGEGCLRYHHIFLNFLRQLTPPEDRVHWHRLAGDYFRRGHNYDAAIYHLLKAGDSSAMAELLDAYGGQLLNMGRLDSLAAYLDALPPEDLGRIPGLLTYMGDLARLHSRFQEALGWYEQAENLYRERGQQDGIARALRGQARVYLDTVNPSRAEELLEKALRLNEGIDDREARARLYELLAENKLNSGKPDEAERLSQQAEALRAEGPSDSQLILRVLLRTGRLEEARQKLETRLEAERLEPVFTPRAHRETLLLLSIIYALLGLSDEALRSAQAGTHRGQELHSPFITAVGHMRQGHALMLGAAPDRYSRAIQQFENSLEISRSLMVSRLRVEAGWGLCRAYGYQGDLAQALQAAQEGVEIAGQAGDEWIASLVRLAYGAGLTLAGRYDAAVEWLSRAALGFQECSDPFGQCAARVWLCFGYYRQKDLTNLAQLFPETLSACKVHGYDFLFTRPSLLGPPDERLLTPLLILARENGWEAGYAARLLQTLGLGEATLHPGFRLHIKTLGGFQMARGETPITSKSWRREKSRQLFQILLAYRSASLDRDQIIEYLWPELDPATAQRNFKVTLNTLYNVLEPEREPGAESAFILREGSIYGLRPGADLDLDIETFEAAVHRGETSLEENPEQAFKEFERAVALYQGEFLPVARYEAWAAAERERLEVLFIKTADRFSELLLQHGRSEEAIAICRLILTFDNCWERAYRHLMLAFYNLGDRGQVARAYQKCVQTLRSELDVAPAEETARLFDKLTN